MKTLPSSNSIIGNNSTASSHFFSAPSLKDRRLCGGSPESISCRRPRKLASSGFHHLVYFRRGGGGVDLISCFASHLQADTQNGVIENEDSNQSKTVRVKFQLQKECTFGEHFFVVGDDPIFGSWDVTNAIPLNWADGHQWAAQVEIPVGKTIQFKFILQDKTGNVVWQPGPDRTFQPWETTNTIIVSEDWDSAESRMLTEEEKIVNQDEDSPIVPEKFMIEENLTYPNDEQIHNTNKDSSVALVDTSTAAKSFMESHGETTITSDTKITEEILKNDEKDATVKILRNTDVQESFIIDYGVPILVPGLPPKQTTSNQDALQHEVEHDVSINGANESNYRKLPENIQMNQKQDPDVEAKTSYEDVVQSETENQSDLQEIDDDIVQNDITWGHKTLKKFFSSLRLLLTS